MEMQALQYDLSIPKYLMAKAYHQIKPKGFPPVLPNLRFNPSTPEVILNGKNWVKLKTLMSGICGSDQNMLLGHESFSMEPYASFPCILGHENIAEIVQIETGLSTNLKQGDRVIVNPVMGCRVRECELCTNCEKGLDALCLNFAKTDDELGPGLSLGYHKKTGGGWANFFQAHISQLFLLPKSISSRKAILLDPLAASLQALLEYTQGQREKKEVFIYGAGSVGLLTIAAIKALELPWKIICGYRYSFQGEMAKKLGADITLRTDGELYKKFSQHTHSPILKTSVGKDVIDLGIDAVFDCVGSPKTIDDSLRFCKPRGKVILVATGNSLAGVDPTPLWFREVSLVGSCMSRQVIDLDTKNKRNVYDIAIDLIQKMDVESLVTHVFPLNEYKKAITVSLNKKKYSSIKVAFNPWE
jgi:threonine dehydrogenase-like Zn-dependent dehydrogenase